MVFKNSLRFTALILLAPDTRLVQPSENLRCTPILSRIHFAMNGKSNLVI
jgi:hypothetical protein